MANVKAIGFIIALFLTTVTLCNADLVQFHKYVRRSNYRATNVVFMPETASSSLRCAVSCQSNSTCHAVNYHSVNKTCEWVGDRVTNVTPLATQSGWDVFYRAGQCDTGWVINGQSCYLFNTSSVTWDQAQIKCQMNNSSLVKVDDAVEQAFIQTKSAEIASGGFLGGFWIGARYNHQYEEFRWYDDSTVGSFGWHTGEPNVHAGCVDVIPNFNWHWNDHWDCNALVGSVCEKDSVYQ